MSSPWTVQYYQRVLATDPIMYWPLNEKSGTVAYDLVSGRVAGAQNGTHIGPTLLQPGVGDGFSSAFYDGANDYTDVHNAAVSAAFNGSEGTISFWFKVQNGNFWTDGQTREPYRFARGGSLVTIQSNGGGAFDYIYIAGGAEVVTEVGISTLDWTLVTCTWSVTADQTELFRDAVSKGTSAGLGAWGAGVLTAARISTNWAGAWWWGYMEHFVVWDRAIALAEIEDLMVIE